MSRWIFTHSDCDGICAGALALAANPSAHVFFTHPFGLLEDLENAEAGDTVIICDIALSEVKLNALLDRFRRLSSHGDFTYIDHHPFPENISTEDIPGKVVHNLNSSASELVYTLFRDRVSPMMSRVALYGAIADFLDATSLITQLLCNWDKRTVYFEAGVLVQGLEGRKREHEFKRDVIVHLAGGHPPSLHKRLIEAALKTAEKEEEIVQTLKEHIQIYGDVAYTLDVPFSHGKTAIYARAMANSAVGVAGERKKGLIDMSIRTCRRDLDLNSLTRRIAVKLGGSGGGHPQAAGARVPENSFHEFIKMMNESL